MRILIDGVEHPDHFSAVAELEAGGARLLALAGPRETADDLLIAAALVVHASRLGVDFAVEHRPAALEKPLLAIQTLADVEAALARGEIKAEDLEIDAALGALVRTLRLLEIDFPNLLAEATRRVPQTEVN